MCYETRGFCLNLCEKTIEETNVTMSQPVNKGLAFVILCLSSFDDQDRSFMLKKEHYQVVQADEEEEGTSEERDKNENFASGFKYKWSLVYVLPPSLSWRLWCFMSSRISLVYSRQRVYYVHLKSKLRTGAQYQRRERITCNDLRVKSR